MRRGRTVPTLRRIRRTRQDRPSRKEGSSMTDDLAETLRLIEFAGVLRMPRADKIRYVRTRGWWRVGGNRKNSKWRNSAGIVTTLHGACQVQLAADLAARQ